MMKTVLVADDEASLRLLVKTTIRSDECEVVEAANGHEAWQLLQQHHPEMAILDVRMPGRTGLELTRSIREHPELRGTYVLLLTSQTQDVDVAAGLEAGADRYMTKPFSPLELLTAVESVLGTS
jgi:CheY-like chemotaxis protein